MNSKVGIVAGIFVVVLAGAVGYSLLRRDNAPAGSGAGAPMAAPQSELSDPVKVHEQWIVALRDGNRPQALAVYAPGSLRDAAVDNQLQRMDSKLHSPASTLGQLVQVFPEGPRVDGAQARGLSRWSFGNGSALCFETKLNRDDAGAWFVTDYGTVPCP